MKGLRSLRRSRKNVAFISVLLVLGVWLFAAKLLMQSSQNVHNVADFQPVPSLASYTTLSQCERKQTGEINCPDIRRKGPTRLRQAQLVLTRLLRNFDLIAKKYGVRYWLYRGTLLGAVRHQGHNPFDDDVDICIPKADFEKFIKFGVKELPEDIFFQSEATDVYYKVPYQTGMHGKLRDRRSCYKYCLREGCKHMDSLQIDMYVLENDSDGNFLELFSHSNWFVRRFIYGPITRKESEIFPLTEVNFDGFLVPAPREWRNILKSLYGDFMKIPSNVPLAHSDTDALRSCEEIEDKAIR